VLIIVSCRVFVMFLLMVSCSAFLIVSCRVFLMVSCRVFLIVSCRVFLMVNGQGSVLAPVLFNLYSNDLPVTRGRKFIYADDICLVIQGQYFSELECSLSSDMARMSHFCRQLRLKPSASKTISSVFHLHNISATRELSVYLDGQRLRHQCHPQPPHL